jgi:hypothetical protein
MKNKKAVNSLYLDLVRDYISKFDEEEFIDRFKKVQRIKHNKRGKQDIEDAYKNFMAAKSRVNYKTIETIFSAMEMYEVGSIVRAFQSKTPKENRTWKDVIYEYTKKAALDQKIIDRLDNKDVADEFTLLVINIMDTVVENNNRDTISNLNDFNRFLKLKNNKFKELDVLKDGLA